VDASVIPDAPIHAQPIIGLIGMGAMGYMYAKLMSQDGWKKPVSTSIDDVLTFLRAPRILVCDLPEKYEKLKIDFSSTLLSLLSCLKA